MFALADALAMQANGNLLGEPEALIKRGLKMSPMFPNGLWLAGMAAEQRQDYRAAHDYWTRLLPLIEDNPDSAREVVTCWRCSKIAIPSWPSARVPPRGQSVDAACRYQRRTAGAGRSRATRYSSTPRRMQGPPMPLAVKKMRSMICRQRS